MYSFEHLNFVGNLKTRNGLFLRTKTHKNAKPGGEFQHKQKGYTRESLQEEKKKGN